MITSQQISDFLASYGYSLPPGYVDAITEMVNGIQPCLDGAGYSDAVKTLIMLQAAAILALSAGARVVTSQGAPSGASQSFQAETPAAIMRTLKSSLSMLDSSGCTTGLVAGLGSVFFSFEVGRK